MCHRLLKLFESYGIPVENMVGTMVINGPMYGIKSLNGINSLFTNDYIMCMSSDNSVCKGSMLETILKCRENWETRNHIKERGNCDIFTI